MQNRHKYKFTEDQVIKTQDKGIKFKNYIPRYMLMYSENNEQLLFYELSWINILTTKFTLKNKNKKGKKTKYT